MYPGFQMSSLELGLESSMPQKATARTRPVRFKVPNNEKIILTVGQDRSAAVLAVLSLTGGAVRTRRYEPGTFGEIKMHTSWGTMNAVIELLALRRDGLQAFRFVQVDVANKKKLKSALESMEAMGLGDKETAAIDHVIRFAKKLFPGKS
jgi:hypothetical protein